MIRCGIGYDVHRFAEGRKLILGGVEIAHSHGHFPNTDESIRGISSIEILKRVIKVLAGKNARLVNIDATVLAEEPKLAPHVAAMRKTIADALRTPDSNVSVKATTNEKLGAIGRSEGIAAIAIATVDVE